MKRTVIFCESNRLSHTTDGNSRSRCRVPCEGVPWGDGEHCAMYPFEGGSSLATELARGTVECKEPKDALLPHDRVERRGAADKRVRDL